MDRNKATFEEIHNLARIDNGRAVIIIKINGNSRGCGKSPG